LIRGGNNHVGILVCDFIFSFIGFNDLADLRFGQNDRRRTMSAIYVVSGFVSAGLLVYLVIALLKPEWF
jgi:K+-transporting ATPase KdpF subunit